MIHRLVLERLLDGGLDEGVRGCVDIGSSFVQHHHFTVLEQCATDADELTLTYRQVVSTFSHLEVQTCSPTTKTVGHVHLLEDVPDALVRVLMERVEVFTEGSTEEHGVLWDDGEAASLMVAMSTSSMSTRPLSKSQIRKSAIMRDDFPAPVRPQIPIFSPAATSKLTPLSTSGSSGRYRRHIFYCLSCGDLAFDLTEEQQTFNARHGVVCAIHSSHDPLYDRCQHERSVTMKMMVTDKRSRRVASQRLEHQLVFVSTTSRLSVAKVFSMRKARIVDRPDNVSLKRLYTGVRVTPSSRLISQEVFLKCSPVHRKTKKIGMYDTPIQYDAKADTTRDPRAIDTFWKRIWYSCGRIESI
ncbi:hypothetical protein P3T76_009275 [Phytophthora citrophthora]|uniref:Uncharacterized protein n=1 Tax=Phytophthora citrophthora TaxID=4793 RepID=A0AAD9GGE8_9STRA|nr:hypothetical protein P3T76_009275 [Phytophthora citrophthora]